MKILVPVDGSKYAMEAVKMASELAKAKGAEIHLLAVCPFISDLDLELTASERDSLSEKLKLRCEEALEMAKALLVENGVTPHTMLASSISVADEICKTAKEEKFDLIVIGSRGLTGVSRFLIGGIADKVVDHAPCSVMVVKIPEEGGSH